ncbi:MAG TPA: flavodoxin family protein [Candidatus Kapabacteria bacterium]|nr:flavodoxin family protein [Candidatus Kapabacteria bacterium]HPO62789.1 flavodoxin family protein [Candidatus Kapabacteria bacterium]
MKIVAINGSPKGIASSTSVMLGAILKGAEASCAEIFNIYLSEQNINFCKGCHSCWFVTPGKCIQKDDMENLLNQLQTADVIILGSPVYFNNISATLKVFIDRLLVVGSKQYAKKGSIVEKNKKSPLFLMVANCGWADRTQFEVVSLWAKKFAKLMDTKLIGEIFATQGKMISCPTTELKEIISNYIKELENAGKEIVKSLTISEQRISFLNSDFK